jgi:hypothetical protein
MSTKRNIELAVGSTVLVDTFSFSVLNDLYENITVIERMHISMAVTWLYSHACAFSSCKMTAFSVMSNFEDFIQTEFVKK